MSGSKLTLSDPARRFLADELGAVAHASARGDDPGRMALTFRPSRRGRDGLADGLVPLDSFRLLVLSHRRRVDALGVGRLGAVLEVLRPGLGADAIPRIRYRRERIHDVATPRDLLFPRLNATAARAAVVLHQAIADAGPGEGGDRGPDWPRLYVGFGGRGLPAFDPPTTREARDAAEIGVDGLRAWPADMLAGPSRPIPASRAFASLAHLKGRRVRNPAFAVLRRRGLIGRGREYRDWVESRGAAVEAEPLGDPKVETTPAGRLRRAVERHVAGNPARERALLEEMRAGCEAFGIRVAEGDDDALAELLDNPWRRPEVRYAGGIQLSGPAGLSGLGLADFAIAADDRDGPGTRPGLLVIGGGHRDRHGRVRGS